VVNECAKLTNVKAMGNVYRNQVSSAKAHGRGKMKPVVKTKATSAKMRVRDLSGILAEADVPLELASPGMAGAIINKNVWSGREVGNVAVL
jgi:hypothetical protein